MFQLWVQVEVVCLRRAEFIFLVQFFFQGRQWNEILCANYSWLDVNWLSLVSSQLQCCCVHHYCGFFHFFVISEDDFEYFCSLFLFFVQNIPQKFKCLSIML